MATEVLNLAIERKDADPQPAAEVNSRNHAGHRRAPRDQFDRMLEDATYLLNHAVEAAIEVEADIASRIIAATRLGHAAWDGPDAGDLANAITKLAAKLHPVTAETLRACREDADVTIHGYTKIVYWLAAFIIPLSMISFIYTGISNSITADLKTANDLSVTLHLHLDTPTPAGTETAPVGSLSELQQFAVAMRSIYSRTRELNWFVPFFSGDPLNGSYERLQLPANLRNSMAELQTELNDKTKTYQQLRLYANNVQDATSLIWGAVGNCILPVLYALLGACASVLRAFTQQLEARTFAPSYATPARFVVAAIGGGIVGLFNNISFSQSLSLSPLALAFLVGYAADIFFSFLEGSMQNLGKPKPR